MDGYRIIEARRREGFRGFLSLTRASLPKRQVLRPAGEGHYRLAAQVIV